MFIVLLIWQSGACNLIDHNSTNNISMENKHEIVHDDNDDDDDDKDDESHWT